MLSEAKKTIEASVLIESCFDKASRYREGGNPRACLENAAEGLKLAPDHPGLQQLREWAEQALEAQKQMEVLLKEGAICLEKRDYEETLQKTSAILKKSPDNEEALRLKNSAEEGLSIKAKTQGLMARAEPLQEQLHYAECASVCEQVLEMDPDHRGAADLLSLCQESLKQLDTLLLQAQQHDESQDFRKLKQASQEALELDPENTTFKAYLETATEGVRHLEKIETLLDRTREAFAQREFPEAQQIAEEILKLEPGHVDAKKLKADSIDWKKRQEEIASLLPQAEEAKAADDPTKSLELSLAILKSDPEHLEAGKLKEWANLQLHPPRVWPWKWIGAGVAAILVIVVGLWAIWEWPFPPGDKDGGGTEISQVTETDPPVVTSENGSLILTVAPWAKVDSIRRTQDDSTVDHGDLTTPCAIQLQPGEYEIQVSNPTFGSSSLTVIIDRGVRSEQHIILPGFDLEKELSDLELAEGRSQ
jgi:tetratricopeptide (TPR) repeat protein